MDMKKQFEDNWKGASIDGAEIILTHCLVPEIKDGYEDYDLEDMPEEAFAGEMKDVYQLGWKATLVGAKYGNWVVLDSPEYSEHALNVLRENFEQAKEHISVARP